MEASGTRPNVTDCLWNYPLRGFRTLLYFCPGAITRLVEVEVVQSLPSVESAKHEQSPVWERDKAVA